MLNVMKRQMGIPNKYTMNFIPKTKIFNFFNYPEFN